MAKGRGIIHNDYVRRKKKNEYYTKKKLQNKWGRQRKHALPEDDTQSGGSVLDRIFSGTADVAQIQEEYEKKLRVGVVPSNEEVEVPKRKKRVADSGDKGEVKKKRRKVATADDESIVAPRAVDKVEDTPTAVGDKVVKKRRIAAASGEDVRTDGQTAVEDVDVQKKRKKKGNSFMHARQEYERKVEEQRKAEEARVAEEAERARKRSETQKRRQAQGRLLNARTARGQPKMENMLQAWLQKKGLKV